MITESSVGLMNKFRVLSKLNKPRFSLKGRQEWRANSSAPHLQCRYIYLYSITFCLIEEIFFHKIFLVYFLWRFKRAGFSMSLLKIPIIINKIICFLFDADINKLNYIILETIFCHETFYLCFIKLPSLLNSRI